jgi:CNT family concentrative nucleoside transporter
MILRMREIPPSRGRPAGRRAARPAIGRPSSVGRLCAPRRGACRAAGLLPRLLLGGLLLGGLVPAGALADPPAATTDPAAATADEPQPPTVDRAAGSPGERPPSAGSGDALIEAGPAAPGDRASEIHDRIRVLREEAAPVGWLERGTSLLGLVSLVALAWLLSTHRRQVPWRVVLWGVALQLVFAVLVLKTGPGRTFFGVMNDVVITLLGFTEEGARFIFGDLVRNNVPVGTPLGDPTMGPVPAETQTGWAHTGAYFAFNVLPTIIFFSSLMALLYHLRLMPLLVRAMAWIMQRTMHTSGAESLSAAANIFVGQTEAPLVIRPYVPAMTLSELHAVMTGGFATVAGGVMAAYVGMLSGSFPDIAGHLIAASVMSAPAALVAAKLMLPELDEPETRGMARVHLEREDVNVVDAAARGAGDGLKLALNVGAMLLAFLALLAMFNFILGKVGGWFDSPEFSIQMILGWVFFPLAWLMGIPVAECQTVSTLLGEKIVLTEFVSYLHLADLLASGESGLSYRSVVITSYALCGFANFGSVAIQLGGIGGIAPTRRHDLARVGLRAMVAGTIAAYMTATIAGLLI